ncbi:MAG: SMC-Scp complex subunit ScpB [Pseudomonadota bacterium]
MSEEPTPGGADDTGPTVPESGTTAETAAAEVAAEMADEALEQKLETTVEDRPQADETDAEGEAAPETSISEGLTEVVHERLEEDQVQLILEAALQAANEPLTVDRCLKLFRRGELPVSDSETQRELIRRLLEDLIEQFEDRGVELKRVASGYRLQVRQSLSPWVSRLWEEKPPRYSRALLETLSLIAYRQPVTRGDIELVRGVAVSSNIIRTLQERGWIREVGHREVPGRPALYGTTRAFLDYFNLKTLSELPPLEEIRELVEPVVLPEPEAEAPATDEAGAEVAAGAAGAAPEAAASADLAADAEAEAEAGTKVAPALEAEVDSEAEAAAAAAPEPEPEPKAVAADEGHVAAEEGGALQPVAAAEADVAGDPPDAAAAEPVAPKPGTP